MAKSYLLAFFLVLPLVGLRGQPTSQPRYFCREVLTALQCDFTQVPYAAFYFPGGGAAMQLQPLPLSGLIWQLEEPPLCDSLGRLRYLPGLVGGSTSDLAPVAVYDAQGTRLPTLGDLSTQVNDGAERSSILVPLPHRPRYALIFYHASRVDFVQKGLEFSFIDGAKRGGRGDLGWRPDSLNVLLSPAGWAEDRGPLQVVRHANGRDLWLIATRGGEGFRSYLITPAGVSRTPVVSRVGAYTETLVGRRPMGGLLQVSANQRTLLMLSYGELRRPRPTPPMNREAVGTLERFTLDPATGRISLPVRLRSNCSSELFIRHPSGHKLAMAPGGTHLYYEERPNGSGMSELAQYNLQAQDSATFAASRKVVYRTGREYLGLMSGLDGRVYGIQQLDRTAPFNPTWIDVIERPGLPGTHCRFRPQAIQLRPSNPDLCFDINQRFSLPLGFSDLSPLLRAQVGPCAGSASRFSLTQPGAVDSVRWHYRDGSGVVDTGFVVQHTFPQAGTYRVVATYRYNGYGVDSLEQRVTVRPAPPADLLAGTDTTLCDTAASVRLPVRAALPVGTKLTWTGPGTTAADTLATLLARQAGTYVVRATLGPCWSTDSVRVVALACGGPVPNILTPDGDGLNEGLTVDEPGPWELMVFDRWGRPVWRQQAYASGTWRGQGAGAGTYFYLLRRPRDGRQLKGWVEVVR